jgi:hypothetical protein
MGRAEFPALSFPAHLDRPATPVPRLEDAYKLARAAGLRFPYLGNVPGHPWENTFCPGRGREVISRHVFTVTGLRLTGGVCRDCGTARYRECGGEPGSCRAGKIKAIIPTRSDARRSFTFPFPPAPG